MRKEQKEIKVIMNGEIDLRKMPEELFDLLIAALKEEIDRQMTSDCDEI